MSDHDRYLALIGDCMQRLSRLPEPERRFIEAIDRRIRSHGMPTPQQVRVLYEIWDDIVLEV